MDNSVLLLKTISDILTAGGAITAFSLLIYVITFKIRDIVTSSYTYLLACVVLILGTDAFFTTTSRPEDLILLLRLQYTGLILLPSAYFYFSNALLTITGKPSEGKRTVFGVITSIISVVFLFFNFTGKMFLDIAIINFPVPSIERTRFFDLFSIYFMLVMATVWYNFIRALNRTASNRSKRRMLYLVIAAIGPALGSFPYLLYGADIIWSFPSIFWMISIIAYFVISFSIVVMTYTVSFFGLPWPDRVIKSRLFKWLMRGPTTAILTLGMTTLISRISVQLDINLYSIQILTMVATIIIFEFSITLFSPYWERLLFSGVEKDELEKIRQLENRLLTKNDLQQFLELIVASFCDLLQVEKAALFSLNQTDKQPLVNIGYAENALNIDINGLSDSIKGKKPVPDYFLIQDDLVFPINQQLDGNHETVGFIYSSPSNGYDLGEEMLDRIMTLISRAATALYDRKQQDSILDSLDVFTPELTAIQSLIASSRFNQTKIINLDNVAGSEKFEKYIKDALSHFFGGPQLSQNPLIQLKIVQMRITQQKEPAITALRAILHEAIDRLKPDGDRQYTNEWLLFNILDLKFIQGWKVRDMCRKLSVSEADFYRKQRIAIKAVGDQISLMEQNA